MPMAVVQRYQNIANCVDSDEAVPHLTDMPWRSSTEWLTRQH